jgi:two-component system, chemotaxis family, chemotaxis protein CheY
MNVLIVDDSKAMRMIVRRTLRQAGYERFAVSEAGSGMEAFNAATAASPALILCDWNMPEMSGLELLEKLKNAGCPSKFGFVTSESTEEMRETALQAGAEFLVTKPFTPESLKAALKPLFGN